jgi:hypothetical protein
MNPYGFIGKFQGLASSWAAAAVDIVKILIKKDRMLSAYIEALRKCSSWDKGNKLALVLPGIEEISDQQVDELVVAYNETSELRGSFGFNGSNARFYGAGLAEHLNRLGTRRFKYGVGRQIEPAI